MFIIIFFFWRWYYLLTKDKNKTLPGWSQRILYIQSFWEQTSYNYSICIYYHSRCFPFVFDFLITREWLSDLVDEFSLTDMLNGLSLFFGLQQIIPYWGDIYYFLLGGYLHFGLFFYPKLYIPFSFSFLKKKKLQIANYTLKV